MIVDLDERRRFGRLDRRRRIAIARRDRQRCELHRNADRRHDIDGLARNLVEPAEHNRALDAVFSGDCVCHAHQALGRSQARAAIVLRQRERARREECNRGDANYANRHCFDPELP